MTWYKLGKVLRGLTKNLQVLTLGTRGDRSDPESELNVKDSIGSLKSFTALRELGICQYALLGNGRLMVGDNWQHEALSEDYDIYDYHLSQADLLDILPPLLESLTIDQCTVLAFYELEETADGMPAQYSSMRQITLKGFPQVDYKRKIRRIELLQKKLKAASIALFVIPADPKSPARQSKPTAATDSFPTHDTLPVEKKQRSKCRKEAERKARRKAERMAKGEVERITRVSFREHSAKDCGSKSNDDDIASIKKKDKGKGKGRVERKAKRKAKGKAERNVRASSEEDMDMGYEDYSLGQPPSFWGDGGYQSQVDAFTNGWNPSDGFC